MAEIGALGTQEPAHRVAVATLGVVLPVAAGLVVSLVQWHAKDVRVDTALVARATASALPAPATQPLVRDGQVLIAWPLTRAPIRVSEGQEFEIVLASLPRENVQTLETPVFVEVQPPPCHLVSVCGRAAVNRWAFVARLPGTAPIFVDYGPRCKPTFCDEPTFVTVVVSK